MTDLTLKPWECFQDASYYDMWCVRQVHDRTFGHGYHLVNGEEAARLRDHLNTRPASTEPADALAHKPDCEHPRSPVRLCDCPAALTRTDALAEARDALARKIDSVLSIETPAMGGDNLAIVLCSHFDNPDQPQDDETGWSEDATRGYDEVKAAIAAHFDPILHRLNAQGEVK